MTRRLPSILAIAIAASVFAASAVAAPDDRTTPPSPEAALATPATIVLEAHVGRRASVAAVATVRDELEHRGFATRPAAIIEQLGGEVPRPGILDADETTEDIAMLSMRGFEAFTQAEYRDAAATLASAVRYIQRNPALLVLDAASARLTTFHAFVGLALSQAKLGDAAASTETMIELLRMFSTRTIDRAEYGPEAEQAYRNAQKQAEALGRGQLAISVDDDRAMIFVNSELRGTGKVAIAELIPGRYHVFVRVPSGGDRQYQVEIRADRQTTLAIEWQVDSALTVSGPWIGLLYASEPERDREPDHASSLARRYRRDEVVVIDSAQLGGKPVVFGTMYRRDGHVVRAAWTPVDGDERKLRALGRFIADGILAPGLHGGRPSNARDGASLSDEWDDKPLPSWPFIAGGMVAVGVGIGLIAIDQDYGHLDAHGVRTAYYWNTAPWGVAAGITGAASIGFGLWWWTRHHSPAPNLSAGRSHVSLGLSGTY